MFDKVVIVGVGLIGGSLGLAIKKNKIAKTIIGVDVDPATLEYAKSIGAIDTTGDYSKIRDAKLCILSATPYAIIEQVDIIKKFVNSSTVVMDVASVKQAIVKHYNGLLGANYIGAHPIAGKTQATIKNAEADLFKERFCVLTPTKNTSRAVYDKAKTFWRAVGAKPIRLSPKMHDKILAYTSHLPHLIAIALIESATRYKKVYGPTFEKFIQIASEPQQLWNEIFSLNKEHLVEAAKNFMSNLELLISTLERIDPGTKAQLFEL